MLLDNNDFTRLRLSTKMIKIIQKTQKQYTDLIIEERLDDTDNADKAEDETEETIVVEGEAIMNPEHIYKTINLDQEIDINTVLCQTQNGRGLTELLLEGQNADEKMITQITHILCDCLLAVYGERPSTFHKDMIARSLVKTYPVLASKASEVPHALWFHKNGRGEGRHAGKIHYRMEYYAKKSDKRVISRPRAQQNTQEPEPEQPNLLDVDEDLDTLINELKFAVPSEITKAHIKNLWRKTIKVRKDHRDEGTFLTFLGDFPVASAFNGLLITNDYEVMKPKSFDFGEAWSDIQRKILERHRDMFRYVNSDFIRALAVVREKNPTRGSKRLREEIDKDLRKINPLHGIIQWIHADKDMPTPDIPQIIVVGEQFMEGTCSLVWKNVVIPVETGVLSAFVLLCKAFTVFGIKCSPADKLFFSFFNATCFKVEALSTTANKFMNLL
ncbi:uncharacterized protein LOC134217124 [Armigeres subalbatus]|uniref:uncharacterized protein LOC134217124 n=1 Tax=Armigeres subalbatus TaxID=124917 RepID=UPI002ED12993